MTQEEQALCSHSSALIERLIERRCSDGGIPRWGGLLVAAWLAGIVVDLLLLGGYYDVALRDVGLLAGALALSRLAVADDRTAHPHST